MKTTFKSTRTMAVVLGLAALSMVCVSCSKDDNPMNSSSAPQGSAIASKMQGSYVTNHRWGGATGLWRYSIPMEISSMGDVMYNGKQIVNPVFTDSTLGWSMSDGNSTNALMKFAETSDDPFFWSDKGSVSKRCAMGWIQNPGEGRLDFRGLTQ